MATLPEPDKSPRSKHTRVTLRDVAQKVGVSHVTISLALRNHPSIPETRREQVRQVAEELGYHLDEIRWTPDCSAQRFEKILLTRSVRGVLIPPHRSPPDWGDFDWTRFSIIRFGMSVPSPDSHLVTADHFRSILMAMETIHRYGYERIGFVVGADLDRKLGGNYIGGYYAAQKLFKIQHTLGPLMTEESWYRERPDKAQQALKQWLARHKPDAVLTAVPEVPAMIRVLGYRIPQDLAVAGTSTYDVPVDAGINQNSEAIGRIAVEMLIAQINVNERGQPPAPCRILVESGWQDGQSLPPAFT